MTELLLTGPRNSRKQLEHSLFSFNFSFWFEVDPSHDVKKKVAAVMRAENGIMMYVKKR